MVEPVFPLVKEHDHVRCVHCGHPLDGRVKNSLHPVGYGEYAQGCNACGHKTFYDLKEEK